MLTTEFLEDVTPAKLAKLQPSGEDSNIGKLIYGDTWYYVVTLAEEQALSLIHICSVLRPYVVGDLPHQHGAVPEVLAQKAVARQHVQLLQHRAVLLGGQRHGGGGHQLLGHGRHGVRLQRIEADALVGGVLVDEPHVLLPVLADNIGFQHLPGDAPRRLADEMCIRDSTYIITPYSVDIMGDLIDELENNGLYL